MALATTSAATDKRSGVGRIGVARVGQLCGDLSGGVWNASEAWPLMLSAVKVTHSLPRLEHESLGWLAVDQAAASVIEIARAGGRTDKVNWVSGERDGDDISKEHNNGNSGLNAKPKNEKSEIKVYHILNPSRTPTWNDLLLWMHRLVPSLRILPPATWLNDLEHLEGHPARKLLGLWRGAYCSPDELDTGEGEEKEKVEQAQGPYFSIERAKIVAMTMRAVKPVSEEQFGKMWAWIERNVGEELGEGEGREGGKGNGG